MKSLEITAAGHATRVLHAPGEGPAIVLLHGASGCAASWERVLHHWSWADVYAPDLPGRALGSQPVNHMPELAGWLADVVAKTAGSSATIVGHSLGGGVGLQLALDAPASLGHLVMVCSSARLRVAPAILHAAATATGPLDLSMAFGPGTPRQVMQDYAASIAGVPPEAALADWQACDAFDVRARLDQVATPCHVVYGSADALTPVKYQRLLVEALPGARGIEVEGAGHMLPWERPAALAEAVRGALGA